MDSKILDPRDTYAERREWTVKAKDLAARFIKNFKKYENNEVAGKALVAEELRALIFTSIQSFEIALRSKLIHHFSLRYGAFGL